MSLLCPLHHATCSHHLVARVYESKAEFRSALQHEKEGYTIYKTQVGHGRGFGVQLGLWAPPALTTSCLCHSHPL